MNRTSKPCDEYIDRITLMTSGDLPEEELAAVMDHLSRCGSCRAYRQGLQGDHQAMAVFSRSMHDRVRFLEKSVIDRVMSGEGIDAEKGQISVYNDGSGIDVVEHPTETKNGKPLYIPEMIFGHLLTSTNYNKQETKVVGGKNGYGAKLTNIFSTKFKLETAD